MFIEYDHAKMKRFIKRKGALSFTFFLVPKKENYEVIVQLNYDPECKQIKRFPANEIENEVGKTIWVKSQYGKK